jgi:putative colanic acid biosynthesis acetyltransferase WcaF
MTSAMSEDATSKGAADRSAASPAPPLPPPEPLFQQLDRCAAYPYSAGEYGRRAAWRAVEATLVRFSPGRVHGWRRFWLELFGAKLTPTSGTKPTTRVWHPWLLTIGRHSVLGERVTIYNLGRVTVGEHTVLSQDVYVCAGTHDYTKPDLPLVRSPITIGSGVWVCAGAFIGPGVTIGDNSVVGARAVVMSDVPPGVVVAGNPARVIKSRFPADGADDAAR